MKYQNNQNNTTPRSALSELKAFFNTLSITGTPTIHSNGKENHQALLVVDFGSPLKQNRLTSEQNQELISLIRKATLEMLPPARSKDGHNVRVSIDHYSGLVYWSTLSYWQPTA